MTERNTPWAPGTPCWLDVMTDDVEAAKTFYGELFGWTFTGSAPEFGGYEVAALDGRQVAGLGPKMSGQDIPTVWTTYLATTDIAATTAAAQEAGGGVIAEPMAVGELGSMAILTDPSGGVFGLWQAGTHTGVELANVAGTLTWNELVTRDFPGAQEFFGTVFGYSFGDMSSGEFSYATIDIDGRPVGGVGSMPPGVPEFVPAHWRVYFAVDDTDATVARVVELGGSVLRAPEDMPYGRNADVVDPTGAAFSVITPTQPS